MKEIFDDNDALEKIHQKFKKRKNELKEFIAIVEKIKSYIKKNKAVLIKKKGEDEIRIYKIRRANRTNSSSISSMGRSSSSRSLRVQDNSVDEDDFEIPNERDWK